MKRKAFKKVIAVVMAAALVAGLAVSAGAAEPAAAEPTAADADDPLSMADATETDLTVTVDGEEMGVTMYEDVYVANPNSAEQQISVYVPENADADSPIMFYVNNSGWQSNSYASRTKVTDGRAYVSTSDSDKVGVALSRGYVIVSYGCRGRNDAVVDDQYINHSPATMTDTKAAIRYLRYNEDILPAGDTDRIVVTGTSGGGALSTVIAASGNSSDYFESLYEIGAAGIEMDADGNYTSIDGIGDDVFSVIAYCPITDFRGADMAYEWTFEESRNIMNEAGASTWTDDQLEQSQILADAYPEYLESLGLTYNGEAVTSENFDDIVIGMMMDEMDLTMEENNWTVEDLINDISTPRTNIDADLIDWLTDNGDGTYTYDYLKHRTWLACTTALKIPCAFSNVGFSGSGMNEDNVFGTINDVYSPFEFLSWQLDATENNVGYDDTGLTWDEYMDTEAGQYLSKQIRMSNTLDYLSDLLKDDGEGDAADDGTPADYWYVRHGMADRDTSFSVEASLFLAIDNNVDLGNIKGANTGFAWLRPHSGDYDVQEAYAWLDEVLAEADADTEPGPEEPNGNTSFEDATATDLNVTVDDEAMSVTMYEDEYVADPNSAEQMISIYVPENADENSPIMFYVNNSGWQSDSYSARTKVTDGRAYVSDSDSDKVGVALSRGYVIVSYGCRGRNDAVVDDQYINHSPATMTDTKAAIRYLRYNKDILPAGDTDRIVVTGTSGGGALSTVIAASGNSSDYFESLYEIGSAGIEMDADGNLTSIDGIGDDVFGVIAYCPITDFRGADMAYEWTFNASRNIMNEAGASTWTEEQLADSATLAEAYPEYLESLGLTYEGEAVTSENFDDIVIGMMEDEMDSTMVENDWTVEDLINDISTPRTEIDADLIDWLTDNGDGTYSYDYQKHRTWLACTTALKIPCAFSNYGFNNGQNEDNLFGTINDVYSPFEFLSWEKDAITNNVGYDDTGLTWDEYMDTEAGQYLSKQIRMTSAVDYLTDLLKDDGDGDAADDGTPAPYWYVRHGMADRDTSFSVEASLFLAIDNNVENGSIESANTGFAWLRPHSGDYDVQEAYAWLDEVLNGEVEPGTTVDKTELQEAVDEAEALDKDAYTADSWEALEAALADAQAVLDDPDATQDDVDAALDALNAAKDNLEPKSEPEVKDGLIKDSDGVWRLYDNGKFEYSYYGFAENANGKWYVKHGIVAFDTTDILKDKTGAIGDAGDWYYVIDSKVQTGFTGLSNFSNQYGWWYIVNGKVDFTRNSVDKNKNGWWYVVGGKVQFGFTGLANYKNENGWWYIQNGAVNFNHNGVDKNKNGWYYVVGGKVRFDFTGLANYRNDNGWWYISGGKVMFNHTGVEKNQNGWWYVKDSKVRFDFDGIASNKNGSWYITDGKVRFSYTGTVTYDGKRYNVRGGKVS